MNKKSRPLTDFPIEWKLYIRTVSAYMQGKDFLNGYKILAKQNRNADRTRTKSYYPVTIIFSQNALLAFSIEMLLKGLYYSVGIKKTGHQIHKLYEELPEPLKKQVLKIFRQKTRKYSGEMFGEFLKKHNNAFNVWRYFNEIGTGVFDEKFCSKFAHSLAQVLEEIVSRQLKQLRDISGN